MITKALYEQLHEELDFRKGTVKFCDPFSSTPLKEEFGGDVVKGYAYENNKEAGKLVRTIVANTYNWMDSHKDVLVPGVFKKSLQERGKKAQHLHDHIFQLSARVGKPKDIREEAISWRALGIGKTGMTEALLMESEIRKELNEMVYNDYLNDEVDQHSIGLRYISMSLAINDEKEYPKEYKEWQEVYPNLGNKAEADKHGYFFVIKEAALIEVSAVLMGANELTPTLRPGKTTEVKSSKDTRLLNALNDLKQTLK